jgi:MacB-like periplasmic core domain
MRAAVEDQVELIAVSAYDGRTDLTYGSDEEMEKAYAQYVSGWMFSTFGIQPAAGRLFVEADDRTPGAHPVAVLSYDYWTRRFGRDPKAVGRKFRWGNDLYEIVGVAGDGFTGFRARHRRFSRRRYWLPCRPSFAPCESIPSRCCGRNSRLFINANGRLFFRGNRHRLDTQLDSLVAPPLGFRRSARVLFRGG